MSHAQPIVSIIIPVLNEAVGIARTLAALQRLRAAGHEILVVDGGSTDATLACAQPLCDRVLSAPRGRASQMQAGAAAARGDLLLFLHADTLLHAAAVEPLRDDLRAAGRHWGRFNVAFEGRARGLPAIAATMNLRSRLTGIATGDQAIFVTRAALDRVGGMPQQPLMEDIELSRRLKRSVGRPLCVRVCVTTSGRRFEKHGVVRTVLRMAGLRLRYAMGAAPGQLARSYPPHDPEDSRPLLQIMTKAPTPGAVKTRLATQIGREAAAATHAEMVTHTLALGVAARAHGIVRDVELWCDPDTPSAAYEQWRDDHGVALRWQHGADLGERMAGALGSNLGRGATLLIGTDCPALDLALLAEAAARLQMHDAVFVPAEDGGYVLVGLTRPLPIFSGVPWGGAEVMRATRARLAAAHARWHELPAVWDIDTAEDLARWRALQAGVATPQ